MKRRRGVTLRRLRLIELLGRHIGLARKGPKPFGGARRELKVRLRAFDPFARPDRAPTRISAPNMSMYPLTIHCAP